MPIDEPNAPSYFLRSGAHTFTPTHRTSGAWRETEQHFSPIGGLVVHAVEQHLAARADDGLVMARITFDILGVVALEEMEVNVATIRPGRTVELLEATVTSGGRVVVIGRIWRLAHLDTSSVAGGDVEPLPSPAGLKPWSMQPTWPGDYIASLDVRTVRPPTEGRGTAWVSSPITLVDGEPSSALASYVGLVDTANGIAIRRSPREWMFPNLDLAIHLHRQPEGAWVGLDTTVVFGPTGQGLTSTVLHDELGPVGRAEQTLTIRPQ
ncbi:MAG: thioesterase [Thermoleophilia bacterium]|nr:thioesterase [Thermoleophilia bacterium]MCZ4495931.1 thioesterase [Thermoleophilia bacterium]